MGNGILMKNNNPEEKKEYIICAAIFCFDDEAKSIKLRNNPTNIISEKGIILCGYRHSNIIELMASLGFSTIEDDITCGFLTSKNIFVTRQQAAKIAYDAYQTNGLEDELNSDHLY